MGIGVDIVSLSHSDTLIRVAHRILTWDEIIEWIHSAGMDPRFLAKRWACKEAVMKSCGTGMIGLDPVEIQIGHSVLGKPYAVCAKWQGEISVSDTGDTVIAIACGESFVQTGCSVRC